MGLTMDKTEIVNTLKALKPDLLQHKVREIGLFGSFARDEQHNTSDIDVLIDFDDEASLFDLIRVGDFLETKLHRKVDVVPKESLREEIRDTVLKEMIVL